MMHDPARCWLFEFGWHTVRSVLNSLIVALFLAPPDRQRHPFRKSLDSLYFLIF